MLTNRVVAGKMDAAMLKKAVLDGGGKAVLKTVSGGSLTATAAGAGAGVTVMAESGGTANVTSANVTSADVTQSNGVIHVLDKVLLPK